MSRLRLAPVFIDILAVSAFTLGGMAFHDLAGEVMSEFVRISGPFMIGFLSCGWAFGAYDPVDRGREFLKCSGLALLFGLLCGFGLRSLQLGRPPTVEFIIPGILFFAIFGLIAKGLYWRFRGEG
jgi:Protein of unknown function (DUF3054)